MRLRTLAVAYTALSAAVIAAPVTVPWLEALPRHAIPTNWQTPVESSPEMRASVTNTFGVLDRPSCISSSGEQFFGRRSFWTPPEEEPRQRQLFDREFGACSVSTDGIVYVLGATEGGKYWLRAYGLTGFVKWTVPTEERRSTVSVGADGGPYFLERSREGIARLESYEPTGTLRWSFTVGNSDFTVLPPAIGFDGTIYAYSIGEGRHDLVAIRADGTELWRVPVPGKSGGFLALGDDGKIYVPVGHGLHTFDGQGRLVWSFDSQSEKPDGDIVLGQDGTVYFASDALYALDPNGKVKWKFRSDLTHTKGDYFQKSPAIGEDGTIYALTYYQQLYAITAEGREKWIFKGPFPGTGSLDFFT